jgi:oligopeptide/dipeptide ABC transporter ATP-binding protein
MKLVEIKNLSISFFDDDNKELPVVQNISFNIKKGEFIGLVGESGCGKSVTAHSIINLLPKPAAKIKSGSISFLGKEINSLNSQELKKIRGKNISMIFQEPMSSLSPLQKINIQMKECLKLHKKNLTKTETNILIENWLKKVGIDQYKKRMFSYPFELSGGMQQRIMIAMALMMEPALLIADEPTTALDVTIQAQILKLIAKLQQESNTAVLFISHDLAVIKQICKKIIVMYAGTIVEIAETNELFNNPIHPYTQLLLKSIPKISKNYLKKRLESIPGQVPKPDNYPAGCHFFDRCSFRTDICKNVKPKLINFNKKHKFACHWCEQNYEK